MKLIKLIPFYGLFLITLSCSNQITSITPSNITNSITNESINLLNAIKSNNVEKVKELLSKNINLKVQNLNGETPLMIASANGNKEIVELICNKYKFDNISTLPEFDWKKANSYVGIVSPIYNKYTNYSDDYKSFINYTNSKSFNKSALLFAIENGHTDIAKYLISEGSDLNSEDLARNTVLDYTIFYGNKDILELLLDKEILETKARNKKDIFKINSIDSSGNTPLMIASFLGDIEMVKYLVSKGADINKKNIFGNTSLMLAISGNSSSFSDLRSDTYLINSDSTLGKKLIYSKDNSKSSPNYKKIVEILLENKANLLDKNNNDTTPLMFASKISNTEMFDFLISKECDIKALDKLGNNMLSYSAIAGSEIISKYLLSKGFDINYKNSQNETPFLLALKNNKTNLAFYFADNGALITESSKRGENALINYISSSKEKTDLEMYKYLISKGIDINAKTADGKNALIYAIEKEDVDLVKELIKDGFNSISNYNGYSNKIKELDFAISSQNMSILKELLLKIDINLLYNSSYIEPIIKLFTDQSTLKDFEEIFIYKKIKSNKNSSIFNKNAEWSFFNINNKEINLKLLQTISRRYLYESNTFMLEYLIDKLTLDNLLEYNNSSNILGNSSIKDAKTIKLLIEKGASFNKYKNDGKNEVLLNLIQNVKNVNDLIPDLVNKGLKVSEEDIFYLLESDLIEENTKLYDYIGSINIKNDLGDTPLIISAKKNFKHSLEYLLEKNGVDIEHKNSLDTNALFYAISNRSIDMTSLLLKKGANPNIIFDKTKTPLNFAIEVNEPKLVNLLLEHKANVNKKDLNGVTPLSLALKIKNDQIINSLKWYGAK